ncbi:MAG: NAD-dependent epimerase/dehydratase family protein [Bacteroidales bacterium]|nr:NAD-dependent epimerase/dehydratase family protein [Bacteroidales bacterium]
MQQMKKEKYNVLVTGGAGFLGKAIVRELLDPASPIIPSTIRIFDLAEPLNMNDGGLVEYIRGDIRDAEALKAACRGIDLVIHSAAIVDWGIKSDEEVLAVNVTGTENVVNACRHNGVRYMVFTSSLDAIYSGKPLVGVDESYPYPEKHKTSYCRSKYLAEQVVMRENNEHLRTVALRPSDIYGEADPYHIGSLVNMARGGFYVRLGNGKAKCQHIYVGNIAYAHLQAAHALMNGSDHVAGQVYFMTDAPGSNFFKFFDQVVEGAGYRIKPRNFWIPRWIAYGMGSMSEFFAWLIRPVKFYHPKFSRFAVIYTCTEYTFNSDKAKRDFGFEPKYSPEEALERTIGYYRKEKNRNFN